MANIAMELNEKKCREFRTAIAKLAHEIFTEGELYYLYINLMALVKEITDNYNLSYESTVALFLDIMSLPTIHPSKEEFEAIDKMIKDAMNPEKSNG